jgi:hypothetical protein
MIMTLAPLIDVEFTVSCEGCFGGESISATCSYPVFSQDRQEAVVDRLSRGLLDTNDAVRTAVETLGGVVNQDLFTYVVVKEAEVVIAEERFSTVKSAGRVKLMSWLVAFIAARRDRWRND